MPSNVITVSPAEKQLKIFLIMILVSLYLVNAVKIISNGEVGIRKTLGVFDDSELMPGVHFVLYPIQSVAIVNIKTQQIEESLSVPSSEGLIVGLDVSVIYHIDPNLASELKQTVSDSAEETLLIPYMRNIVRDVVGGRTVKDVYSDGRAVIAKTTLEQLAEKLTIRGVIVEDVLLRDVIIPQKVKEAIELKLQKEQEALQKEFELISAKKDAEILIVKAGATAESQEIISSTLSKEYLDYLWIENLKDNSNVIYVATEANVPIFKAS